MARKRKTKWTGMCFCGGIYGWLHNPNERLFESPTSEGYQPAFLQIKELGLRSDGVVVWRNKKAGK